MARRRSGSTHPKEPPKEPPMTAETQSQAAMLTTVASHLTDHPHLCPVNILSEDRLQLRTTRREPARELVTWADSLTGPRVDVQCIHCEYADELQAFVYVVGQLDDVEVSVWDVVPGLVDALTPEAFDSTSHVQITVDALRAFAEDGTAPVPVGELAPA